MDNLSDQVGSAFHRHILVDEAIFAWLTVQLSIFDIYFKIGL